MTWCDVNSATSGGKGWGLPSLRVSVCPRGLAGSMSLCSGEGKEWQRPQASGGLPGGWAQPVTVLQTTIDRLRVHGVHVEKRTGTAGGGGSPKLRFVGRGNFKSK